MKIILEGPDNSGKSTLAARLAATLRLPLYIGKGPVKSELDYTARWMEYVSQEVGVYDRHFCVSERIYQRFFNRGGCFEVPEYVDAFYQQRPVIIYCRNPSMSLAAHTASSPVDTPEYLEQLCARHVDICHAYDDWAKGREVILYAIGMPFQQVLWQIERSLAA